MGRVCLTAGWVVDPEADSRHVEVEVRRDYTAELRVDGESEGRRSDEN